MKTNLADEFHKSWHDIFQPHLPEIEKILNSIENVEVAPRRENIFRAFRSPLEDVKVVIVGQDPYPGEGVADGLAFSTRAGGAIPASLRNILKEYSDDLSLPIPLEGDLTPWSREGVLLLNRTLTTEVGQRNIHKKSGWAPITEDIARTLGARGVVGILWGASAQELAPHFKSRISSVHPSPLSAYRGFFGSRPFSRANDLLLAAGRKPVNWQL